MPVKFFQRHTVNDGSSLADVLLGMIQYDAKQAVASTSGLTDSSGGTPAAANALGVRAVAVVPSAAVDTALSGSNLADKTTTEAAMGTVLNALATLYAKANATATTLGIPNVTYNGGGTSGGSTIAAVTQTVTASNTVGSPSAGFNPFAVAVQNAFYQLGVLVNKLNSATGNAKIDLNALKGTAFASTVAAISTNTGTAAAPSATAAYVQSSLTAMANNVATFAAVLNVALSQTSNPPPAAAAVTVGASPFAYANPNSVNTIVTVTGGTVSAITLQRGGTTSASLGTSGVFHLAPGDILNITYTVVPAVTQFPNVVPLAGVVKPGVVPAPWIF